MVTLYGLIQIGVGYTVARMDEASWNEVTSSVWRVYIGAVSAMALQYFFSILIL